MCEWRMKVFKLCKHSIDELWVPCWRQKQTGEVCRVPDQIAEHRVSQKCRPCKEYDEWMALIVKQREEWNSSTGPYGRQLHSWQKPRRRQSLLEDLQE